jgi:hypothetical protein
MRPPTKPPTPGAWRENVDLGRSRVLVVEQFNAKTRTFTPPKNGLTREAPFDRSGTRGNHGPADRRRVLLCADPWRALDGKRSRLPLEGRERRAGQSLYLATRHFAGWYMVNILDLPSEDVAIALGHTDGGELVRRLYGHCDHERALDRVTVAYERTASFSQPRLW